MILHTVVPEFIVFQTDEAEYKKQRTVYYNGIPLLVQQTETNEYEIVRLLSSDPQHYLTYGPGTKLCATSLQFMV
ncbi:YlzJ-like family protein [Anoxybacillus sp.]|uniref:YlzJ-like family protein n=1 Tax=Anoxybacillus sp. TaxID=1872573 RepID=UPI0026360798|nr:YlzJ-like family protein [uncultured Anoxybacillus sp.]